MKRCVVPFWKVDKTWPFNSTGTIGIGGTTFGNTHFYIRNSDLGGDVSKCDEKLSDCVQNIGAENVLDPQTLEDGLKQCLRANGADELVSREIPVSTN